MQEQIDLSENGLRLPLMEDFYSIQGEGHFVGNASYFLRLAGCDVGCFWCDVPESWHTAGYPVETVDDLVKRVLDSGTDRVIITGGEPAMHNLFPLTAALKSHDIRTHIETSGTRALTGSWDWICFSPKKFKKPIPEVAAQADELKVIVYNQSDFEFAEANRALVSDNCRLFLQPEWSRSEQMIPAILNYVREHPSWRIGLQTHKFLGVR